MSDDTCCIAGHFPWLPPTPKPTLGSLPVRDANRALITAEDRAMAATKGKGMQKPWREVTRLVQQHGRQLVYELSCRHVATRWHPCTKTTCGTCPREMR